MLIDEPGVVGTVGLPDYGVEVLIAVDGDYRIVADNIQARRLFGREIVARSLLDLGGGGGELQSALTRARAHNGTATMADVMIQVEARQYRAQVHANWLAEPDEAIGGAHGIVALHVDPMRAELGSRDRERARAQLMHHLVAGLAHEIRNPLAAMRGAAQLIARPGSGDGKQMAQLIIAEADRIEGIVAELMDVAKPRVLMRRSVELPGLVHRCVTRAETWAADEGVDISMDLDPSLPPVEGDEELLARAIDNLLKNAVAWAGQGSSQRRVAVSLGIVAGEHMREAGIDRGRPVWLRVDDDGPGVDETLRPQIFDPMISGRAGGTGLGLYTVRRVVEEHGGSVEVGTSPWGGARFSMTMFERLPARGDAS